MNRTAAISILFLQKDAPGLPGPMIYRGIFGKREDMIFGNCYLICFTMGKDVNKSAMIIGEQLLNFSRNPI